MLRVQAEVSESQRAHDQATGAGEIVELSSSTASRLDVELTAFPFYFLLSLLDSLFRKIRCDRKFPCSPVSNRHDNFQTLTEDHG